MSFDHIVANSSYTYGCGCITDGKLKLIVHIAQFTPDSRFVEGIHIKLKGELKLSYLGKFYLKQFNYFCLT